MMKRVLFQLKEHTFFYLGLAIVLAVFSLALLAPFLSSYDPTALDLDNMLAAPSAIHLMGTDALGRDVFTRIAHGGMVSLWVGFVAVGISLLIGTAVGLAAGYFGGIIDEIAMRVGDVVLCFPSFFLILAVIAFLEPSMVNIMAVIGLTSWVGVARLVRAETMSLKQRDFVAAARLSGAGPLRILLRHILPNAMAPALVSATLGVAGAILLESSLSFLGLGVQPPMPSWGNILIEGKQNLEFAWWLSFFPGLCIFVTVLGYNLLGDGLRDMLDPKKQR